LTSFSDDTGMTTQQLGYSILTAPLAAIDRRGLSQAWYSALHLARDVPATAACEPSSASTRVGIGSPRRPDREAGRARDPLATSKALRASAVTHTVTGPVDRRAGRLPLARRIERTFLDPERKIRRATFTLDGTNARVHVALQTGASGMRLVAVCPPTLRAGVARALDQARYALAVRGITLSVAVQ
jgi:hypothetical protein